MHLRNGSRRFLQELQSLRTESEIELTLLERQLVGRVLEPFDLRSSAHGGRLRNLEHPRIDVHADHSMRWFVLLGCEASGSPRSATDVQDRLVDTRIRPVHQGLGGRAKDGGDENLLVSLRGVASELPFGRCLHG